MPKHIINQDILDGFAILGLPTPEHTYNENPEEVIFAYTGNFKTCTRFKPNESVTASFTSVAEARHAELGKGS